MSNEYNAQMIDITELKPHPKNYRKHSKKQLEHIVRSIEENGFYRNIVSANDKTILAGHGVWEASKLMGLVQVPVIVLPFEPNSTVALKVLSGDNEISRLAEIDDRGLGELLKTIQESESTSLLGTGFDDQMLAGLLYISRTEAEINNQNEADEWIGMPDFEAVDSYKISLNVHFETEEDKQAFADLIGAKVTEKTKSVWYPVKPIDDVKGIKVIEQ